MKKRNFAKGLCKSVAVATILSAGLLFSAEAFSKPECDVLREKTSHLADKVVEAANICMSLAMMGSSCNGLQDGWMRLLMDAQQELYACEHS